VESPRFRSPGRCPIDILTSRGGGRSSPHRRIRVRRAQSDANGQGRLKLPAFHALVPIDTPCPSSSVRGVHFSLPAVSPLGMTHPCPATSHQSLTHLVRRAKPRRSLRSTAEIRRMLLLTRAGLSAATFRCHPLAACGTTRITAMTGSPMPPARRPRREPSSAQYANRRAK